MVALHGIAAMGLSVGGLIFLILSIGTVYWSETEEVGY